MANTKAGSVAIQQALVKVLGLSYRQAEAVTGVNHRTIWQHVAAAAGSNVAAWSERPPTVQAEAIVLAKKLIAESDNNAGHHLIDGGDDVSAA